MDGDKRRRKEDVRPGGGDTFKAYFCVGHLLSRTTCAVVPGLCSARFVINEQGFGQHRRTQDRGSEYSGDCCYVNTSGE
jgi:hypothetical protein